ncbi:MAG: type II toxin-antitoxin system HicB family antitoxin [Bacillota bacterium]|nr:type II toxin-antitoxin system HicB family antitoxin [Clostridiales bacterium]MDD6764213.1 type II toxin-antitoxin system HicB family antitoxin [Bacillota bacterium]MDO4472322.1 type II toxin-antitoxin system HicB family antitoxin [Bacillota bacterium]
MKYVYPAIFKKEKASDGRISYGVSFPDIQGCVTCGDDLPEAIAMAEDALALILYSRESKGEQIPEASEIGWINPEKNEFVSYIACDTLEYHRRNSKKSVKKTLTIPEWLNEEAVARNINFSKVLQEGLKSKLGIL